MKTALVLFSMGGPDTLEAIKPFLYRLFSDPAILRAPAFVRKPLAWFLSNLRAKEAQKIYAHLGGASPLYPNTLEQAKALERVLTERGENIRCFVGMSYWHPFISEAMEAVRLYQPDRLILLPLYPQYSTTTTQSVLDVALREIEKKKISAPVHSLYSFQTNEGFIAALRANIEPLWQKAQAFGAPKLLFSAHGLPESIVRSGDPYPQQCQQTCAALQAGHNWDSVLCYQSRVGPLAWIGPSTEALVRETARARRPILIAPIAFVSEHSETLVELDIIYRRSAEENGAPFFAVVPTVQTHPLFINGMADLVTSC